MTSAADGGARSSLWTGPTMPDMFVSAARRFPDRTAIVDRSGPLTFRQLEQRVSRMAGVLTDHGVGRGDTVAQLGGNSADAWSLQFATYSVGARFVGLHERGGIDDQLFLIEDSQAQTLVVDDLLHPGTAAELASSPQVRTCFTYQGEIGLPLFELVDSRDDLRLQPVAVEADVARLAYTGGTTGRPKGVLLTHRSLVANTMLALGEMPWPEEVRFVTGAPITHGAGSWVLPTFLKGGTLILLERFTVDGFLDAVETHRATAAHAVPTMIYDLLDAPRTRTADLRSMKMLRYGAAPMTPARIEEALEVFGPVLVQGYGQTEAPNTITLLLPADHVPGSPRLASVGRPFAWLHVAVLDADGNAVPPHEPGEICVRGPLVMEGYWNRPEETAAAFEHGWLHTGDIAYADEDGYLFLVDRKKDVIITGGFNVFSREVENVLATHPAVAEVVVLGVPDERWGEAVKAVVRLRPGASATSAELQDLVRERKGAVHAPKSVDFVVELPKTSVGKPDKKAIRAWYWSGQARQVH
jgi:fatty-acyl-CoA synthase